MTKRHESRTRIVEMTKVGVPWARKRMSFATKVDDASVLIQRGVSERQKIPPHSGVRSLRCSPANLFLVAPTEA